MTNIFNKAFDIWLSSPSMSEDSLELNYINEAFESNWIAPYGPNIDLFESELVKKIDGKFAVALSSGTAAIHMALVAAGVKNGDKVICQSFTFSATANPIIYQGAIPVFIDSDLTTWSIDLMLLEKALIEYGKEVKAVIVVHIYGLPCPMDELLELCKKFNVILIEDAAESLGSLYKGKYSGTVADYGIFSFNGNKIITTSGGGMLVSPNKSAIQKVKFWSTQSRDEARHYEHSELGFNYRMSNISAGIGRGQLTILEERVDQKRRIFEHYKMNLGDLPGISFMPVHDWQEPNYWLSCIITNESTNYLDIIMELENARIQSRPLWKPMHLQPFFREYPVYINGVSEQLFNNGLCLPSDTKMTTEDLAKVCSIVRAVWKS
jgi:dTDP-4-amino-4,6-dideoxygalactose transaminase